MIATKTITTPAAKSVVGRLHIQLHPVVVSAQVSKPLPHEDGLILLADVNLVGVKVLDKAAVATSLHVVLNVVASLKDVVSLTPAKAFPSFSQGLSLAGEVLSNVDIKIFVIVIPYILVFFKLNSNMKWKRVYFSPNEVNLGIKLLRTSLI